MQVSSSWLSLTFHKQPSSQHSIPIMDLHGLGGSVGMGMALPPSTGAGKNMDMGMALELLEYGLQQCLWMTGSPGAAWELSLSDVEGKCCAKEVPWCWLLLWACGCWSSL